MSHDARLKHHGIYASEVSTGSNRLGIVRSKVIQQLWHDAAESEAALHLSAAHGVELHCFRRQSRPKGHGAAVLAIGMFPQHPLQNKHHGSG